jgi:S1-C subfamily serine protease
MTKTIKLTALMLGIASIAVGAALFANSNQKSDSSILEGNNKTQATHTSYSGNTATPPVDFEKAATAAVPSVVHIKTVTKFKEVAGKSQPQNPFGDEGNEFFKKFFGDNGGQQQQQDQRASGSGVIISADGYIVTNNHYCHFERQKKLQSKSDRN